MDNVDRIIQLEGTSDKKDSETSDDRWKAAKLIWTELQTKSFRQLSDELRARQARRFSLGYLQKMNKCWTYWASTMAEIPGIEGFPDFKETYNSDAIQMSDNPRPGPMPMPDPGPMPRQDTDMRTVNPLPRDLPEPEPRENAGTWINDIERLIARLEEFPAYWQLVSPDDIARLNGVVPRIRTLIAAMRQRQRRASLAGDSLTLRCGLTVSRPIIGIGVIDRASLA